MTMLKIGRTDYCNGGLVKFHRYAAGGTAIQIVTSRGEPVLTATVCFPDEPLPENEVWIKDWSENSGVLAALEKAKIIEVTGRVTVAGYELAYHARLTPKAIAEKH